MTLLILSQYTVIRGVLQWAIPRLRVLQLGLEVSGVVFPESEILASATQTYVAFALAPPAPPLLAQILHGFHFIGRRFLWGSLSLFRLFLTILFLPPFLLFLFLLFCCFVFLWRGWGVEASIWWAGAPCFGASAKVFWQDISTTPRKKRATKTLPVSLKQCKSRGSRPFPKTTKKRPPCPGRQNNKRGAFFFFFFVHV